MPLNGLSTLRRVLFWGGGVGLALVLGAFGSLAWRTEPIPPFEQVKADWQPSDAFLEDRQGQILQVLRVDPHGLRLPWLAVSELSPTLTAALLAAEDRRFYDHHGVDGWALGRSLWNWLGGQPARGASTLTMQVAALLDRHLTSSGGRRSPWQKLLQIRQAWALERVWSKQQILEAYVNRVGLRGEWQGIAAASEAWFGKHPLGLSEAESALLVALLPDPNVSPARIAQRACGVARAADFKGVSCETLRELGGIVPLRPRFRRTEAELAPHLAQRLLKIPGERLRTTLDLATQRQVLDTLRQQLLDLSGRNVRDAAALLVDNSSGEVLAYVGSAGSTSTARRVNGVTAPRQAGSTLKPFLYGLALERRYLTAASILRDAPLEIDTGTGLYTPQDYERDYQGLVTLRTALASSLNTPTVRTLILIGPEVFRKRLVAFGYRHLTEPGRYYGYALALESAEVTLWEQAGAYLALANGGLWRPLKLRPGEPDGESRRILDPGAAYIITDILGDPSARAVGFGLDNPLTTSFPSAVKTGTSKNMRDNWCIGFTNRYTLAVWVGNFEGDPMRDVSGISGAAPAWQVIMNALSKEFQPRDPPVGLIRQTVHFEREREQNSERMIEPSRSEWFLAGTETDRVRVEVAQSPARILTPSDGLILVLDPDIPPGRQSLRFQIQGGAADLVFYLDDRLVGPVRPAPNWFPVPGQHILSLRGANGREWDRVHFEVRGPWTPWTFNSFTAGVQGAQTLAHSPRTGY
ncbi:penicillin-binding protein 1C [Gammaproteobacteria bacterium]